MTDIDQRPKQGRMVTLISVLGLLGAVLIISIIYLKLSLPAAEQMRTQELDNLLKERASRLNGMLDERARFAQSLASLGEDYFRLKHSSLKNLTREEWISLFGESLNRHFDDFPEIVGGGIWYEPHVFDRDSKYSGFYTQWVPPVGSNRKLEFTMEWSDPSADYHNQEWYRTLIAEDQSVDVPLEQNTVWTAPYRDPVTGVVMITVDAAMYSDQGQIIGMSTVDWNLDQIGLMVENTQPTERSQAFLFDPISKRFIAVASQPELALASLFESSWGSIFKSNNFYSPLSPHLIGSDSENFWVYAIPLSNGLQFGFRIPHEDIFGEVRKSLFYTLALIILTLVILFIAFAYFSNRAMRESLAYLSKARDEALRVASLKTQFLTNMSHEIRTPMNGVIGMLDLEIEEQKNGKAPENLILAHKSAKNLLRIINDILDFSKLEAGKLQLNKEDFNLRELLESLSATYETLADSRGITLVCALAPKFPDNCFGDAGRISQIVVNLVGNALKFSDDWGGIIIYAEKVFNPGKGEQIRISVSDSGIGIAKHEIKSVFEPFSQSDGSSTRIFGGTGLGLSIAQSLAREMKGEINVRSRLGVGSAFTLELPYQAAGRSKTTPSGKVESIFVDTASLNMKILVAEDNPINQKLIQKLLQKAGCSVTIANDGNQALAMLSKAPFDIALLDIQMPNLDGFGTLAQIRAGSFGQASIPTIALTAHAMKEDREEALAAGFNDYLTKPIDRQELYKLLNKYKQNKAEII